MDAKAWEAARRLDARVILWDVDSRDWTKPGAKRIAKTVVRDVRPGSVVLFHDGGGNRKQTVAALPKIIRRLKKKGYTFVTVEELSQLQAQAAAEKRARRREAAGKKARRASAESPS
jgi:peptidoglycan/xylan/chitin deacetylase (PgdA/CDA1 family)